MNRMLAVSLVCAATACGPRAQAPETPAISWKSESGMTAVGVWTDPDTGCEYLIYSGNRKGAMQPRMAPNGKQMCGGNE